MLYKDEINKILKHPGRLCKIRWTRILKKEVKASCRDSIEIRKSTTVIVRLNVSHDNRKEVITARECGDLPDENQGLNGFVWEEGFEKVILRAIKTSELYLRVYPATNMGHEPKVEYYVNGASSATAFDDIKDYFIPSYRDKVPDMTDCFNISLDYIVELLPF